MKSRSAALAVGLCVAWAATSPAAAQPCTGDCSGDRHVAVDELITCVNIALEMQPLSHCPQCNAGSDAAVGIDDLVAAVDRALHQCPSHRCGDGFAGSRDGEGCDDGNMLGGDGCAANCTRETRRLVNLDSRQSISVVESGSFPVTIHLVGSQGFITGQPRDTTVMDSDGNVITRPGEIPVVMKATDLTFDPAIVTGLACVCVRAVPVDEVFGPGNSAAGVIGCGAAGLNDIDYTLSQDDNCPPGNCGRRLEPSGGSAPRGSALINYSTRTAWLDDGGICQERRRPNGTCTFSDYGPDCMPCTGDDADFGTPENLPATTGLARAVLHDADNPSEVIFDASAQGAPFDCDALLANPTGGLSGAALATAFPSVDAPTIGENVTTTVFGFE